MTYSFIFFCCRKVNLFQVDCIEYLLVDIIDDQ